MRIAEVAFPVPLPKGFHYRVPDGMVVMGVPGKIVRPVKPEELQYMKWLVPHYVELAQKYVDGKMGPTIVG